MSLMRLFGSASFVVLSTPLLAGPSGSDAFERDIAVVRAAAEQKYRHVLSTESGDPLRPVLEASFCRNIQPVRLPDLCRAHTSSARAYVVTVLPVLPDPVSDVFVLSENGEVYSLLEDDSISRLLADYGGRCSTAADLQNLALTHLRLLFSPENESWRPARLCDGSASNSRDCLFPAVRGAGDDLKMTLHFVVSEDSPNEWLSWEFGLSNSMYRGSPSGPSGPSGDQERGKL